MSEQSPTTVADEVRQLLAEHGIEAAPRLALTPAEVAHELSLGRTKTLQLIADGTIPSVKIDRARRILRSDLVAYVESLRAESANG